MLPEGGFLIGRVCWAGRETLIGEDLAIVAYCALETSLAWLYFKMAATTVDKIVVAR